MAQQHREYQQNVLDSASIFVWTEKKATERVIQSVSNRPGTWASYQIIFVQFWGKAEFAAFFVLKARTHGPVADPGPHRIR